MATLQKIRTKAGLLVAIVIGISLAAFVLGDMLSSGSSLFQKSQMEVGEIDGESIQYPDFQKKLEELGEIYKMNSQQTQLDENTWVQVREQTWQNMVRDIVMGDVYKKLGIEISSDELFDMLQGTNLHPIIQQMFSNPNTGQVDRGAVVRFLKNLETGVAPEQRDYWFYLEQQIVKERVQSKYNNMVGKGLFVTSEEAQNSLTAKNNQINFEYVSLVHSSVADSQVVVNEKDLKEYYNANENIYTEERIRKIEFITYSGVVGYISNLNKALKNKGISLIIIQLPKSKYYMKNVPKQLMVQNDRLLDSMYRFMDIPYYNFTNDPNYTDQDFRDVNHLNYVGAKKFSETLSKIIGKNLE